MNPKQKVRLSTPNLSPGIQREVDELQRVFARTREQLEKLEKSGHIVDKSTELSIQARKAGNDLLMQKGHNVHTHRQILKQYSQSIAFAPQDTEELVLGYGNRSALLMHLQHYEEALIDIDRALQLSKSDDYKKKLQTRKEKCLGLLNEQNMIKSTNRLTLAENKELEKIKSKVENFKPSVTVPSAADCVGVAYNDQLGRHLVATRDIKPGEVVIVERGYACCPILSELYLVCSHCLQYAWNGIPCDECVYAIYCSEDCKNEAFNDYHDIECPILKYMHPLVFNTENGVHVTAAIRTLVTALKQEGFENIMKQISEKKNEDNLDGLLSDGMLRSDSFKACYNLSPYIKDIGTEYEKLEFHVLQMLYLLTNQTDFLTTLISENPLADKTNKNLPQHDHDSTIVDPCILLKFKEALMRLKSIITTNGYPIQTGTYQCGNCNDFNEHMKKCHLMRGTAVVPSCSLINHSCTPNLSYLSVPKRRYIAYSICSIKKGEMLCASYRSINVFNGDKKARDISLKSFICKCRACLDNINIWTYMNQREKDMSKLRVELKKKCSASVAKSYLQDPLDNYEISEKTFQEMIKISQLVYKHFNYYKAFAHNIKCYCYIEMTIGKFHKEKIHMPNDC